MTHDLKFFNSIQDRPLTADSSASCSLDDEHCITCGDSALPARVITVDSALALAQVEVNNQTTEVDISLVDAVRVGQILLVHGGVALGQLKEE